MVWYYSIMFLNIVSYCENSFRSKPVRTQNNRWTTIPVTNNQTSISHRGIGINSEIINPQIRTTTVSNMAISKIRYFRIPAPGSPKRPLCLHKLSICLQYTILDIIIYVLLYYYIIIDVLHKLKKWDNPHYIFSFQTPIWNKKS